MGLFDLIGFVAGLLLLVVGAEALVRGATRLAAAVGISPIVVGLTVVAWGTSTPELAVSLQAALEGNPNIALGNVVGSNIFNVLGILGLAAMILPLTVAQQFVRREVPIMIGISVLTLLFALDGRVGVVDGAVFVVLLVVYTVLAIRFGRQESAEVREEYEQEVAAPGATARWGANLGLIAAGLVALVLGSRLLVAAAREVASALGVSDLIIGLTIVAIGTSLPEVAASVIAAIRGHRDIAVGNVIGSNIYNLLAILGTTAVVGGGIDVPAGALRFDLPVMLAVAIACLPVFFTGLTIGRFEGAVFVSYYVAYTVYLIFDSTGHDALGAYSATLLAFVIPVTAIVLVVSVIQAIRAGRAARPSVPGG